MSKTIWIINTESRYYSWFVAAETKAECLKEFKRMWRAWCKSSGAELDYWRDSEGLWGELDCTKVTLGAGYMDRELFR